MNAQTPSLEILGNFKFWRLQHPAAVKLLKEIIFRWRGASAYVPGKAGNWVVWPRERWCHWTGLSRNQLDRALKELADTKLIERERHRFGGKKVLVFLRPTLLALKYLGKPHDIISSTHPTEKIHEQSNKNPEKKVNESASEKMPEKTDYTSLSFSSTKASCSYPSTEGPGKHSKCEPKESTFAEEDDVEEMMADFNEKKKSRIDAMFPEKKGPHSKYVKHPSNIFPKWYSFSRALQAQIYKKYLVYIENWTKGKKGQEYFGWTDEDDMALLMAYEKTKKNQLSGK